MTKILFLGDLFYDYDYVVEDLAEIEKYIKDNHLKCILNLEGPITKCEEKYKGKRGPCLKQNLTVIEVLKRLNVIGVTLSNNHMFDYGEKGLIETMQILDDNKIKHVGCGKNLEEAVSPMVFDFGDGKKTAIYSFGWNVEETYYAKKNKAGCSPLEKKIVLDQKYANNDINICAFHWGFEFNKYPMPKDIKLAHQVLDGDVDLVVGHHTHNIQPYEDYNGKKVFYSLGNFYFASRNEGFNNIALDKNIKNYCNYGVGVVFDVETKSVCDNIEFYIDVDKKKVHLVNNNLLLKMNFDDFSQKEYIVKAKNNKVNRNPILVGNAFIDGGKILYLYTIYFLIRLKHILKGKK